MTVDRRPTVDREALEVLELTGAPSSLVYPDVCAHCGMPARERLSIEKVFTRTYRNDPSRTYVIGARVPFCPPCTARHEREAKRVTPLRRMLLCLRAPVLIAAAGAVFVVFVTARPALADLAAGQARSAALPGAIAAVFALIAIGCVLAAWRETRRYAVVEHTSVTGAFDFSDDVSEPFDKTRHVYKLTNPLFAERFGALNHDRAWDPKSPRATWASRARLIALVLVLAGGLAVMLFWNR